MLVASVPLLVGAAVLTASLIVSAAFRRWLSSMRAAIVLLLIVAALAVLGVAIGQGLPVEAYAERHGETIGAWIVAGGLANVFHTWYFGLTALVLGASMLSCSIVRLARLARASGRQRVRRIGSLVTHLAIVVVLAGGFVTAALGFRYAGASFLGAGDVVEVPEGGFSLRVDEARTEFSAAGVVSEYVSVVAIIEDGSEVGRRRIEVNSPLTHRGIGVYQFEMLPSATRVEEVLLGVVIDEGGTRRPVEVVAPFGKDVPIPGTGLGLFVLEFLGDFTYDIETRTAGLRSVGHDNPAVLVQVREGGRVLGERWLFPGIEGHEDDDGLPCRLFFLDYRPDFRHGLTRFEFSKQPGTPLVFVGFVALSIGLGLTFWTGLKREGNR